MKTTKILSLAFAALVAGSAYAQQPLSIEHLKDGHAQVRVTADQKCLLLPIEENAPECFIKVQVDNTTAYTFTARLAVDKVDFTVPFELDPYKGKELTLEVNTPHQDRHSSREPKWTSTIQKANGFDVTNREKYRPEFHHTPAYGWMNDPNGMFYLDGTWHLYYQYNPYGSRWGNMNWAHATSTDLVHWEEQGVAIAADGIGTIFSGSCVVDHENTAGFGKGAVIALYTSDGIAQRQCMAYSTDGGKTFTKYPGNPILSADIPDFRDPNMFWNEDIKAWNLILACGQEMRIYSSPNLRDWKEESRFGLGYGSHDGVWECPDLMRLPAPVAKGEQPHDKWVLFCNINPGFPAGGSGTQYFIGDFDGHKFTCDTAPEVTKWQDYGKDHYATVSFSNAPEGRHTMLAWMSNWQYANDVPTQQYRSGNSIGREPFLYTGQDGQLYLGSAPSPEYDGLGLDKTLKIKGDATITLSNEEGEEFIIRYDQKAMTLSCDRSHSGETDFSKEFAVPMTAPVHKKLTSLRIFIDRSSVEIFGNNGEVVMTNLVFPKSTYSNISIAK